MQAPAKPRRPTQPGATGNRPRCWLKAALGHLALCPAMRSEKVLVAAVMLGSMAFVMTTVLPAMAVPLLSIEFHLAQRQAQWTNAACMLAMAGSMLTTPWLLKRLGLHRTYGGALLLLVAGAVVCASAGSFTAVVAGRALQGLAAGVMQPMPAVVVLRYCPPAWRGRTTGLLGMAQALAVALGPLLAGLLIAQWGWRMVFLLAVPFAGAAALVLRGARGAAVGEASAPVAGEVHAAQAQRLDWRGLLLCNGAAMALLQGLVQVRGGSALLASLLMAVALIAAMGFVAWQKCLQQQVDKAQSAGETPAVLPLVNLQLFAHRRFAWGCVATLLYGVLLYGSGYLLPLLMQRCMGLGVQQVGISLLVAGLVMAASLPVAGRLLDLKRQWPLVSAGYAAAALALLAVPVMAAWGWLPLTAAAALLRLGLGVALASAYVNALNGLPESLGPQGASLSNYMQALGGACGVGACGLMLDARLAAHGALADAGAACSASGDTFQVLAAVGVLAAVLSARLRARPADTAAR